MIRAAAKNHAVVTVVVDPADYARSSPRWPRTAAPPAWRCARRWPPRPTRAPPPTMRRSPTGSPTSSASVRRPGAPSAAGWRRRCATARTRTSGRRFYLTGEPRPGVATAVQHQGKELSYNNLDDTDAAFELVAEFDPKVAPAVAIIKHANPCGVALGADLAEAYAKALRCDPVSRLRRHHRPQRPDRRGDRARDHRHLHRGGRSPPTPTPRPRPSSPARRTCAC